MVELIIAVLLALGGFLAGRNYERKHPTTAEEAELNRVLRMFFTRKKDK